MGQGQLWPRASLSHAYPESSCKYNQQDRLNVYGPKIEDQHLCCPGHHDTSQLYLYHAHAGSMARFMQAIPQYLSLSDDTLYSFWVIQERGHGCSTYIQFDMDF